MQSFHYHVGNWKAQARVLQVDDSKLMATICVLDDDDEDAIASQHTIVFDHKEGFDTIEETKWQMKNLLESRYGG